MLKSFAELPWGFLVPGYAGLVLYLLTSVANEADQSLGSIADIFFNRGRTILTGVLVVPILIWIMMEMNQLNPLAAFFGGYTNISLFRKIADNHMARYEGGVK